MTLHELIKYIKDRKAAGLADEAIKQELRAANWKESEIEEGFVTVTGTTTNVSSTIPHDGSASYAGGGNTENTVADPSHPRKSAPLGKIMAAAAIASLTVLGIAYAYVNKVGPFSTPPYKENNLISGILDKINDIKTSSYLFSGSINVNQRDSGALPFAAYNDPAFREKYFNDYKRVSDARNILNALTNLALVKKGMYPSSLEQGIRAYSEKYNLNLGSNVTQQISTIDPVTKEQYGYSLAPDGKNFSLSVVFETKEPIYTIKNSYGFSATSTIVEGEKVTFTASSTSYLYLSSELPKPFLVQAGELSRMIPVDTSASMAITAAADWGKAATDWKFDLGAQGNFSDLAYAVDVEALRSNGIYYVRINKMPSLLFFSSIASLKGQWLKIDPSVSSTASQASGLPYFSGFRVSLPDTEKAYKDNIEKSLASFKKVARFADEAGLIKLKQPPFSENVGGRQLYRYELDINKSAIKPFLNKVTDETDSWSDFYLKKTFDKEFLMDYVDSKNFDDFFDYYNKNTKLTVWIDPQGYPAIVEYKFRIVPPDTAIQLKDKQVNLTFTFKLSDINVPVSISVPSDSKPLQQVIDEMEKNVSGYTQDAVISARDARRIADISTLKAALELYKSDNGYYPGDLSEMASVKYLSKIPVDPSTNQGYFYASIGGGKCTGYHLGAKLETQRAQLTNDSDTAPRAKCAKSEQPDFNGYSESCVGVSAGKQDLCYDVSN